MIDVRPVGYVVGLLLVVLGMTMLLPLGMDVYAGNGHWPVFLESSVLTVMAGVCLSLACANSVSRGLSIRQIFLVTTSVWLALPFFGAIPFVLGAPNASYTDAFFEAMSGLTTTGASVFGHINEMPEGILLWRGLLQWIGGIGIVVVAMVFLPELRVGGMQIFRSEGFDTFGKILPRAAEIASQISVIYLFMTVACALSYVVLGMEPFDAIVHSMTTVSTGGFANQDTSFGGFSVGAEYACILFMILAALPFVRYVQMIGGSLTAPLRDPQVRGFLWTLAVAVAMVVAWQIWHSNRAFEPALRKSLFNLTSVMTGTGYSSEDFMFWGPFPVMVLFFLGLIGGCAGSTACSIKIFRYQLFLSSVRAQIRTIYSPRGVFPPRYDKRPVSKDVLNSVMSFFVFFVVSLGVLSVSLSMTGLDFITSVSAAAASLGNIGIGLGDVVGPSGSFGALNPTAKWLLSAAMLIGRLEVMAVYVILTVNFWRG